MELQDLREEIRKVDEDMATLFERRMEVSSQIAEYKKEHGMAIEDVNQEAHVIESRSPLVKDEELRSYYVQFLKYLMTVSKRWQRRVMHGQRVAFCAAKDDNISEAASIKFPDGEMTEYASYKEAYDAVSSGECDAAVLPFETSHHGDVGRVLDLMYEGNLYVNDIFEHKSGEETVRYAVLSRVDSELDSGRADAAFLLMFTVKDETGGLAKAINIISAYSFNMRILRSRPRSDSPWHYYFYAEVEGEDKTDNGKRMLNALRAACPSVKVAGRYRI